MEREHTVLRLLCQRLKRSAKLFTKRNGPSEASTFRNFFFRATFLSSILYGRKILSSLKLAKGYIPALLGLRKTNLSDRLIKYFKEQTVQKNLQKCLHSLVSTLLKKSDLRQNRPVHYFKRSPKFGSWHKPFVRGEEDHILFSISKLRPHRHAESCGVQRHCTGTTLSSSERSRRHRVLISRIGFHSSQSRPSRRWRWRGSCTERQSVHIV